MGWKGRKPQQGDHGDGGLGPGQRRSFQGGESLERMETAMKASDIEMSCF